MKVLGINGSARKDGNTAFMIHTVFKELEKEGIETELIQLSGKKVNPCLACMKCKENKDKHCAVTTDFVNECIDKVLEADAIILGSPTYFADISSQMKALIDRIGSVARANGDMLKRKIGAAVIAARRGGCVHAFDSINHFFFISQMIVPGSNYWNMGIGMNKGDVLQDAEGIATMTVLGQNMAWLLKKLKCCGE